MWTEWDRYKPTINLIVWIIHDNDVMLEDPVLSTD